MYFAHDNAEILALKKPAKIAEIVGKPRSLEKSVDVLALEKIAQAATYHPSTYHCPDTDGRVRVRTKPASRCPQEWSLREATNAVRDAIKAGKVSRQRTSDGFPRHIWHNAGGLWYEACTSDNAGGIYHGYPVETRALPSGLV